MDGGLHVYRRTTTDLWKVAEQENDKELRMKDSSAGQLRQTLSVHSNAGIQTAQVGFRLTIPLTLSILEMSANRPGYELL